MSTWSRQQPGSACEECRKRKLRCDRQKPKCGTCLNSGIKCEVKTDRLPRGPKRGSLNALRSRIVQLEKRLLNEPSQEPELQITRPQDIDLAAELHVENPICDEERDELFSGASSNAQYSTDSDGEKHSPRASRGSVTPREIFIPELMGADLDQLYFDRAHAIVPILHKGRYFSWSKQPNISPYGRCLRNAMWTLAISLSTQFQSVREMLYVETRQMLEALDLCDNSMEPVRIEQLQAWILITLYEFLRTDYRRGWISAGRVFRMVQLARLHEIDSGRDDISMSKEDIILTEEKRRAFWVAYCLDRFISVRNGFPLTLTEDVVCTRLPALELEFQNEYPTSTCFLSEAIAYNEHNLFSPLAECAIMATIYGRTLSHYQVSTVEQIYGNGSQDFWLRHEWINGLLAQRLQNFSLNYSMVTILADPMLLFTYSLVQASILHLYKILEPLEEMEQYKNEVLEYQTRAMLAAQEIAHLAKEHTKTSYLKCHVFMPLATFLGAEHLIIQCNAYKSCIVDEEEQSQLELQLKECMDALQKMQSVNNVAKYYLNLLESGSIAS
ncbi:fungal-specific transcription factor domain-containing protein [Xylogone sp. PMI_703]|nr:fungal-specific transcription factor domain-containing protein [Xylogone sp. PMI_703]